MECDLCFKSLGQGYGRRGKDAPKIYRLEFKFEIGEDEREIKRLCVCETCAVVAERVISRALMAPSLFACATAHDHEWGSGS